MDSADSHVGSCRFSLKLRVASAVIGGIALGAVLIGVAAEGTAQTFDAAASAAIVTACGAGETIGVLAEICGPGGTTTGSGAISAPAAAAFIEERRRLRGEGDVSEIGANSDTANYNLGGGVSAFITAGAEVLNHRNNRFEDGYSSVVPTVAVGADYRLTDWMTAGLAVNYTYHDGTYDDGGRFDTHSYGPLLFASFTPLPNFFTDVALVYNHQDNFRKRRARAFSVDGSEAISGSAQGSFNGDQYSFGVLAGYDRPVRGFTVGPRAGLDYVYTDTEDYEEASATGLQVRYQGLNQNSLQTTLGAVATMPISTSFGVVQPQLGVSWVHEFLNNGRNIQAELLSVVDPAATRFTFKREQPARDWAVIDLAVSMVLPNQLQPFVSFTTIQGNENFVSYGGVIGARKAF